MKAIYAIAALVLCASCDDPTTTARVNPPGETSTPTKPDVLPSKPGKIEQGTTTSSNGDGTLGIAKCCMPAL